MVVEIDGSEGEGGGQMLRTAITLSAVTGKPFRMHNIRAKRPKPGLSAQHLEALLAVARITDAEVEGAYLGSKEVFFRPKTTIGGDFSFKIGTAGSTMLLLQTVYLPLAFAGGGSISIEGGTHTKWSPPFDFVKYVFCRLIKRMGCDLSLTLERAGFYPRGGGRVSVHISGCSGLKGVVLAERGELKRTSAIITLSRLPGHIAEREARRLRQRLGYEMDVRVESPDSPSAGNSVLILCEFESSVAGFSAVGERGVSAEAVADEAADAALELLNSGGVIDARSADQLLLPAALADGETVVKTVKLTNHIMTNADVLSRFLKRSIELEEGRDGVLIWVR